MRGTSGSILLSVVLRRLAERDRTLGQYLNQMSPVQWGVLSNAIQTLYQSALHHGELTQRQVAHYLSKEGSADYFSPRHTMVHDLDAHLRRYVQSYNPRDFSGTHNLLKKFLPQQWSCRPTEQYKGYHYPSSGGGSMSVR